MDQIAQLTEQDVIGEEHWTKKDGSINLFMFNKYVGDPAESRGTLVFVHGSSMASQPTFDFHCEGRPFSSAMNYFALLGFDTWCVDMEGYGRSDKDRDSHFYIQDGANDLKAACDYINDLRGISKVHMYGISSGALRAALFAQDHPDMVDRLLMDATVWKGTGSPTLVERSKKLPQFKANRRRPIDVEFVRSIFTRDHPGCAEDHVVEAFAEAVCKLDTSIPNGTYVDMCENLPVVDPEKLTMPCFVMRGQWDGIAGMEDLLEFFNLIPNPDKQFTVMAGISHASFQQKNYRMVYHVMEGFLTQPAPIFKG
ncbi:MAG: alpha/beta hydrolase [Rhodospirillaceae bacterium]|jgi:pimeloyl-ACP methyl ester carboxylesterase|nr:alpha/beta hydrolase [Rhodospirillaceae bacterium]MBT6361148.1 alpha/beta hydrolase [Rhodospirillaceae bacterium]